MLQDTHPVNADACLNEGPRKPQAKKTNTCPVESFGSRIRSTWREQDACEAIKLACRDDHVRVAQCDEDIARIDAERDAYMSLASVLKATSRVGLQVQIAVLAVHMEALAGQHVDSDRISEECRRLLVLIATASADLNGAKPYDLEGVYDHAA